MKKAMLCVLFVFMVYLFLKGFLETKITRIGINKQSLNNTSEALLVEYSVLLVEKQELSRRDRIINYAEKYLEMDIINPELIIAGDVVREIRETRTKKDTIFTLVDRFTPYFALRKEN